MADAGIDVALAVSGPAPAELPATVDLTGYRVIQESLTNVLRHSGAHSATVTVRHRPGQLEIDICNPVISSQSSSGGSGIDGMRDRVEALGGQFRAGLGPGPIFEVHANFPTGGYS
jgi:signal transduction histidine kinase